MFFSNSVFADRSFETTMGAKIPGLIGSSDHLYLRQNQIYFQPLYNDFIGNTDKFVSNESILGYVGSVGSNKSLDLRLDWRVVTPAVQFKHGDPINKKQIGIYADWLSLEGAYAYQIPWNASTNIKIQAHSGLWLMQNLGAKKLQSILHDSLGRSNEKFTFNNLEKNFYSNIGMELGVQKQTYFLGREQNFELLVRNQYNAVFSTVELEANFVGSLFLSVQGHLQYKIVHQLSSNLFTDIHEWHQEAALGVKIWRQWTPSVRYVSPYLKADNYRQLYLDFLSYNF